MADAHRRECSPLTLCRAAFVLLHVLLGSLHAAHAQDLDYPTAGLSTTWTSTPTMKHVVPFADTSQVRSLLLRRNRAGFGHTYAFGFYCRGSCNAFLLAVFIIQANSGGGITSPSSGFPQVVWAANRSRPVGENATLRLGPDGDLVLADADGTKVWSTNTSGKSVSGVSLTDFGNLVLFGGARNQTIWQSFAYPTDSLVPGQKLLVGQSLTANDSSTNSTEGVYYLYANSSGLIPFIKANPSTRYASVLEQTGDKDVEYFEFMNGSITTNSSGQYMAPTQFLRLESDGHLRVYEWSSTNSRWNVTGDLLNPGSYWANCFYPTVCGRYGICSANQQCGCPQWNTGGSNYFVQVDTRNPSLGCKEVTPFSCQMPYNHSLLRLDDIAYFTYDQYPANGVSPIDEDGCRSICAANCSCRAASFRYSLNTSAGSCYLASEVFSLRNNQDDVTHYNSTTFIKVQIPADSTRSTSSTPGSGTSSKGVIIGSAVGALFFVILVIGSCILMVRKRIRERDMKDEDEEDDLEQVSGMPKRFSLEELRVATDDFRKKLGQGGFGSVYEGSIEGTTVAVKRLDGVGQGRKEFLAEVQTIGKVHHVNLVKLIGYCAAKSCRLLVYEFMPNGSLDRWIFSRDHQKASLDWETRCKIILGVAKGLCYLHEECSQRIAHLDIKPQNILLDDRFEAKVSDFGLAKLIDRDQTHVETRMRGTPGYLAPEWLSSMITEKVDVYSFGVVVLEMVCGRRNLDRSQPEEDALLVGMLKRKGEKDELLDLVDEGVRSTDRRHVGEAVRMIQIARWCLQEHNRRPSMSTVVKALEGTVDVETNHLEEICPPSWEVESGHYVNGSTPLPPSVLSGPR